MQDKEAFGGKQVILCGDFFQLPPVCRNNEDSSFVNTSQAWKDMDIHVCYLDEQHRHTDKNYMRFLNEIRENAVGETGRELLMSRYNQEIEYDIEPTKHYTHNAYVDAINSVKLSEIDGEEEVYHMTSDGNDVLVDILKKGCLAPERLALKKDAVVMFVKNNFAKGYVNGTLGKVADFDGARYPIVETIKKEQIAASTESWEIEEDGTTKARISQMPLRLAWAITVHKSQGMSLDAAEIDLSRTFEYGMGYVALSRVRSLGGLKLRGINDLALQVSDEAIVLDGELKQLSEEVLQRLEKLGRREKKREQEAFLESRRNNDVI